MFRADRCVVLGSGKASSSLLESSSASFCGNGERRDESAFSRLPSAEETVECCIDAIMCRSE